MLSNVLVDFLTDSLGELRTVHVGEVSPQIVKYAVGGAILPL